GRGGPASGAAVAQPGDRSRQRELAAQGGPRYLRVGPPTPLRPPFRRPLARRDDPFPDLRRGFALAAGVDDTQRRCRPHPHAKVDPVEQWPGEFGEVAPSRGGAAPALGLAGGSARARIRRQHQLELRRIPDPALRTPDAHLALLEHGAQRREAFATELRSLVE